MAHAIRFLGKGKYALDGAAPGERLKSMTIHFDEVRDKREAHVYHCVPGSGKADIVVVDSTGKESTVSNVALVQSDEAATLAATTEKSSTR
jgi:hypothetical protein